MQEYKYIYSATGPLHSLCSYNQRTYAGLFNKFYLSNQWMKYGTYQTGVIF